MFASESAGGVVILSINSSAVNDMSCMRKLESLVPGRATKTAPVTVMDISSRTCILSGGSEMDTTKVQSESAAQATYVCMYVFVYVLLVRVCVYIHACIDVRI